MIKKRKNHHESKIVYQVKVYTQDGINLKEITKLYKNFLNVESKNKYINRFKSINFIVKQRTLEYSEWIKK